MSTPRDHSRIRSVISSSNIDFQGSVPERMLFSHADDLRPRAPLLGWLKRLGYGGSVVFSLPRVQRADCDVTLGELEKAGVSPQESAMDHRNPQRNARLQQRDQ